MGLAIEDRPEGPYVKYEGNPVINGNHEVLVWPQGDSVASMIGDLGPPELVVSILNSEDDIHFKKTHDVIPRGPNAEPIEWGVSHGSGILPFMQRLDLEWPESSF